MRSLRRPPAARISVTLNKPTVFNVVLCCLSGSGSVALNPVAVDQPFGKFILNAANTIPPRKLAGRLLVLGNDAAMGVGTINTRNNNMPIKALKSNQLTTPGRFRTTSRWETFASSAGITR